MIEYLTEPFTFTFMRRALLAAALAGGIASLVGTFVILRGMAFLGGALSHAVLPGIALAYITGHSILLGAFAAGLFTVTGISLIGRHQRLSHDTAIGIFFSGMFALGIAIISTIPSYTVDLTNFLFGNVLAVSVTDIWAIAGVALITLMLVWLLWPYWIALSFDPVFATALGLPVQRLNDGLMILLAIAIVVAMQAVGVLLVVAMLVTPSATARLLARRVPGVMLLGVVFSTASALGGLYASYYLNIASGAAIVLVSQALFFLALIASTLHRRRTERKKVTAKRHRTVDPEVI